MIVLLLLSARIIATEINQTGADDKAQKKYQEIDGGSQDSQKLDEQNDEFAEESTPNI